MTTQAIIGIFQTGQEAQQARKALLEKGFPEGAITIDDHVDTVDELVTDGQMTDTTEKSDDFLGIKEKENREGSVLTVQVSSADDLTVAIDILNGSGAVDVNEFSRPLDEA